jgi:hypothetical protein
MRLRDLRPPLIKAACTILQDPRKIANCCAIELVSLSCNHIRCAIGIPAPTLFARSCGRTVFRNAATGEKKSAITEKLATAENIFAGMKLGCNHAIGSLALANLIGLDTMPPPPPTCDLAHGKNVGF